MGHEAGIGKVRQVEDSTLRTGHGRYTVTVMVLAVALIWSAVDGQAQTTTGECTFDGIPTSGCRYPDVFCGSNTNWAHGLDLDGDGRAEFLRASVYRYTGCTILPDHYYYESTSDSVEALFPQPGVEMYLQSSWSIPPALEASQPIRPDGTPPYRDAWNWMGWQWNPAWAAARLRHSGIGLVDRTEDHYPCESSFCDVHTYSGWLRENNPYYDAGVFGFRLAKPDGWHLGWLRLRLLPAPVRHPDGYATSIEVMDHAIHPDPDTPILAGEPPRPNLKVQVTDTQVLVSWSTNWLGWGLTWTPAPGKVRWSPVSEVVTNTNSVAFAPTNAARFFRLAEPIPPHLPGAGVSSVGTDLSAAEVDLVAEMPPTPGTILWEFKTDGYPMPTSVRSGPAIGRDGVLYFGAGNGRVYALWARTGKKLWEFRTTGGIGASPSLGPNGMLYVSSGDNYLYALSAKDGTERWRYRTWGRILGSAALGADGTVYIGTIDGYLVAIGGRTGQKLWELNTGSRKEVQASPIIGSDGVIYLGSMDGALRAIDAKTHTAKWSFGTGGAITAAPALTADGAVLVASMSGNLYAVDIATGKERWRYRTGTMPPTGVITGGAFPGRSGLLLPANAFYGSPIVGPDGGIYIGSMDLNFYAVNGTNGTPRWAHSTPDWILSTPAIGADHTVYVGSYSGGFGAFDAVTGATRWVVNLGTAVCSPVTIGPDGVVYVGTDGGKVYAIQGGGPLADSPWPMHQQNLQHTGRSWPPDPSVVIWRDGKYVRLQWETGILQAADDPSGPWREVPDAKSPRFLRPSESRRFYRTLQ